jgi:hypothetical protein
MRKTKKNGERGKGYRPKLNGLIGKDGRPVLSLELKDLKPPTGGTAIARPQPATNDKTSHS